MTSFTQQKTGKMKHRITKSITNLSLVFITCLTVTSTSMAQTTDAQSNRVLVHNAIEDYVLALYNVEPDRIARSVDTTLHKIGYYDHDEKSYNHVPMTYQQLYDLAAHWNKNGDQANDESPKVIDIYEVHDKTASAKLTAKWGIDFMHLSKVDGRWKINNIMWQSNPK